MELLPEGDRDMLRFISYLLNREREYEPCKSCQIVQYQLEQVNREKRELLEVILDLVRPKVTHVAPAQVQVQPVAPRVGTWGKRRSILEESDRNRAAAARSQFSAGNTRGKPDEDEQVNDVLKELENVNRELATGKDGENENASQIS